MMPDVRSQKLLLLCARRWQQMAKALQMCPNIVQADLILTAQDLQHTSCCKLGELNTAIP
jgi:hypothetical protein